MPYLIHCDTFGCVYFRAIIGIANDRREILELLYNYNRMIIKDNYKFETDYNDVKIYEINEENYSYLKNIYKEYEEEIENYLKNELKYEPENINTYFWFAVLNSDNEKYMIFNKEIYKEYKKIINNSKLVFN